MQLLSFHLANNLYGLDITKVQEIRVVGDIRTLPNTPDHCIGVIDFRNTMVPVLDMREMFGYPTKSIDKQTVLIVVSVNLKEGEMLVGVMVDAVSDVLDVTPEQLKKNPTINQGLSTDYMLGMFKHNEQIVVVMDMEAVVQAEDINQLKQLVQSS